VEVTDERHIDTKLIELSANERDGRRGFLTIHGDPDEFRPRPCKRGDLGDGLADIGGIRVGHRLNHDRGIPAHDHIADPDRHSFFALNDRHRGILKQKNNQDKDTSHLRFPR
jgi:hypothetical protein